MIKRQVFYSFHFKNYSWRAGQVRNIGVVEGNSHFLSMIGKRLSAKVMILLKGGLILIWIIALVLLCYCINRF